MLYSPMIFYSRLHEGEEGEEDINDIGPFDTYYRPLVDYDSL